MKKLLILLTFGIATLACGDRNRSAERDMDTDETDVVTPDIDRDTLDDDRLRTDTTYNRIERDTVR